MHDAVIKILTLGVCWTSKSEQFLVLPDVDLPALGLDCCIGPQQSLPEGESDAVLPFSASGWPSLSED